MQSETRETREARIVYPDGDEAGTTGPVFALWEDPEGSQRLTLIPSPWLVRYVREGLEEGEWREYPPEVKDGLLKDLVTDAFRWQAELGN